MAAHSRAHAAANPELTRARGIVRRAREAAAGRRYSDDDVAYLRKAQKDRCAYCHLPLHGAGHVDHMTSIAKGGSNARDNLVLACYQCNTEKHAKSANEYFLWRLGRGLAVYGHAYAYRKLYGK
jgi:5-methylcytosine-specific restriction endonuclease McrA